MDGEPAGDRQGLAPRRSSAVFLAAAVMWLLIGALNAAIALRGGGRWANTLWIFTGLLLAAVNLMLWQSRRGLGRRGHSRAGSDRSSMYSHYLPDGPHDVHDYFWHLTVEDETGPYADPERLGSVFVRTEQDGEGWSAYWIRDQERHTKDGTRTEVVAWARQQDAGHRWLYEPDGPWYLPLPPPAADSDATVYVAHVDRDDWYASWQRGEEQRGLLASRDAVLAWARSQPADHRWLWDEGRYTPLQD